MTKAHAWPVLLLLATGFSGCGDDVDPSDAAVDVRVRDAGSQDDAGHEADAGELDRTAGVYALKLVLDMYWGDEVNAAHLVEPGRGAVEIYYRAEFSGGAAKLSPCGIEAPPVLLGVNCTAIQMQFPAELWDAPGIPTYEAPLRSAGFDAGALSSRTSGLLGLDASDLERGFPAYGPEPYSRQDVCGDAELGVDCYPDHDGDGQPGITMKFADMGTITTSSSPHRAFYECRFIDPDWTVQLPPPGFADIVPIPSIWVSEAYVGMRLPTLEGVLEREWQDDVMELASSDTLAMRSVGCKRTDGEACLYYEHGLLDSLLPRYHVLEAGKVPPEEWKHPTREEEVGDTLDRTPSVGPRVARVRLGDPGARVSCADVRGARFPEL